MVGSCGVKHAACEHLVMTLTHFASLKGAQGTAAFEGVREDDTRSDEEQGATRPEALKKTPRPRTSHFPHARAWSGRATRERERERS